MYALFPYWETYQEYIHWQNITQPHSLHMRSSSESCHQKLVFSTSIVQSGGLKNDYLMMHDVVPGLNPQIYFLLFLCSALCHIPINSVSLSFLLDLISGSIERSLEGRSKGKSRIFLLFLLCLGQHPRLQFITLLIPAPIGQGCQLLPRE